MTQDNEDMILKCLKQIFETDFYVKFRRVLEDLIADSNGRFSIVLNAYNDNLKKNIDLWQDASFTDDFPLRRLAICKAKLFSLRFIYEMANTLKTLIDKKIPTGRNRPEKNLKTLIKVLLYHVLMSKVDTDYLSLVELEQISVKLNLTMTELFQRYRRQLLKVIVRYILRKLERHTDQTCCISRSNATRSSDGVDSNGNENSFKHNCAHHYMTRAFEIFNISRISSQDMTETLVIITYMISEDRFHAPVISFLRHLAIYEDMDVGRLLDKYMQTVMVDLLLRGKMSTYDLTEALKKLSTAAGRKNPRDLLITKFFRIKGNLLLYYSTDEKKVRSSIEYLSSICKDDEFDRPFDGQFDDESAFIEYISPSMIGILLGIDGYFNQVNGALGPQHGTQYIKSITQILQKLGRKQVQSMHHKILSTFGLILRLRPDRKDQQLNEAIIEMWRVFIEQLGDLLNSLTLSICVALYDLIEDYPEKVAELYELLILKNSIADTVKFQSLFFIPDSPPFKKIHKAIMPHVHRGSSKPTLKELEIALNCALPLTKVENQKCHVLAATRIRDLLKSNQSLLLTSMLANPEKPLNSTISKTIQCLLAILSTKECSSLIAECLGMIGAVNPARVNHLIYGNINDSGTFVKIPSDKFLITLIEMLKNSLLSDRTSESEDASYALQVIIETYNVQKQDWFKELSNEARKACDLCKDTNYAASAKRTPPSTSTSLYIRFKNEGQYSYSDWLDKFFLVLIPLIQDAQIREVLQACTYNFKYNLKLAEYLIPVVTTNLILFQDQSLKLIHREFMAIITDDVGVSSQDLETVHRPDFEQNVQTLHYQCANMVFCILDLLARFKKLFWGSKSKKPADKVQSSKRASGQAKIEFPLEQHWNRLDNFTSSLPKDKLAVLANRCRAHARSLYYLDHHFFESMTWDQRDTTKNLNFDAYWTLLQKVFMALDDNHEAAGVQMRRTSLTTLTDDIANLESSGRFDKAVIHYESLLELNDQRLDKKVLLEDALKCLSNQGDDQRLYERSKQLMERYPNHARNILPAAVEAFCKLGKWDELDQALKSEQSHSIMDSTSMCHGRLLNSIVDLNEDVSNQLRVVRNTSVKPLSIAMVDRSAYYRGYQNLLFLHSIEDHSLALDVLKCKQFQTQHLDENTTDNARTDLVERLRSLFRTWNTRNKLVQPSIRSLEPLLAWQRSISSVLMKKYPFVHPELSLDVGTMWLDSAKIAREARCFDRSFYCIAQAQKWFGSDLLKANLNLQIECIVAQAKIDWDQGESIEAIRFLKASIQRLQGHGLLMHLEALRNQDEDGRRKENNPYHHPDDESHLEISDTTSINTCQECSSFVRVERESFAKLKLLLTKFTEEAAASTPRSLITMYGECVHLAVNQEEVFLLLARYYDKLANYYTENPEALRVSDRDLASACTGANSCVARSARDSTGPKPSKSKSASQEKKEKEIAHKEEVISKLMEQSVFAFGHSLKYGVRYLEESFPRMLNIWYDLCSKKSLEKMSFYPRAINSRIEKTFRLLDSLLLKPDSISLPSYYFMVALSLLLSRVCHTHPGTNQRTHSILAKLLKDYPHQMMWRLASLSNDDIRERKESYNAIISSAKRNNPELAKTIADYDSFIGRMSKVTKNFSELDSGYNRGKAFRSGPCQISDIDKDSPKVVQGRIITPTQSSINPILPTADDCDNLKHYNIYPDHYMSYIHKFEKEVYVYNSLQKPRRVGLVLHDGKTIHVICKVGDDLRKDSRCIEFFNLLNRILHRGGQSNERFFEIATFLVLPLESKAGIIEMVPNCVTYRSIIEGLYKEELGENFLTSDHLKKRISKSDVPDAEMYQHFLEKVLPKMKYPVFHRYLQRRFTDPTTWYMARLAYTRSTALISIAGYIIGLGDRHLDNILIDADQGRIIHVDFNLLFHQADFLPIPEVVPFRLTRNIVAGFGPMGTEGNFRRYCEIAMRTMRNEKELLLTTLKPFLYDPCCDWTKDREQNRKTKDADQHGDGNKIARDRIDVVEKKLRGFPKPGGPTKPLTVLNAFSVEAQVDILIEEATNIWNLSQMYYGWAPHC